MTQQQLSFRFSHLLVQHDAKLINLDSVCAEYIIESAFKQFLVESTEPWHWIKARYDHWLKNHVFVSANMPDKCKRIIQSI